VLYDAATQGRKRDEEKSYGEQVVGHLWPIGELKESDAGDEVKRRSSRVDKRQYGAVKSLGEKLCSVDRYTLQVYGVRKGV
jgi:hypothetical protein